MRLRKLVCFALLALSTPATAKTTNEIQCLTKAMYTEAGGLGDVDQKAIAYVVLNRLHRFDWPPTICGVVQQHGQFSGTLKNVPASQSRHTAQLATDVLNSYPVGDPTNGALFFHNKSVHPHWKNVKVSARINNHIFYKYSK